MDHNNSLAGITITSDSNDALAQRLRSKLRAEVELYEAEQRARQAQHDKYMKVARSERDHIACSDYRTRNSGLKPEQLSEDALIEVSKKLLATDDAELRRIFGRDSDSRYAGAYALANPIGYRVLRRLAQDKGII